MEQCQIENERKWFIGIVCFALIFFITVTTGVLNGCSTSRTYTYKVIFKDGTSDYFELKYKPEPGCNSIEYEGETIIGVKGVERVKF